MRVAFYARYSSDRQRDASIEDQFRNCARFAEAQGWSVVERYRDAATSGAKADRPGYKRMLADAESSAFEVLLVDDLSRLSRDELEMKRALRRLHGRGVRVIGISDGVDTARKDFKLSAGLRGLMNELYLDDLREKTHRGLEGQARKGLSTGGRVYGYRSVPIEDSSRRDEYGRPAVVAVKREIDPEQAAIVRWIFEAYADGRTPRAIADELNRRGVPAPKSGSWAAPAIYGAPGGGGMLNNELYIGRSVWNREAYRLDPETGKRRRVAKPQSEHVVKDTPELRIVPQDLWDRVKARQTEQRRRTTAIQATRHARARTGAPAKYLFSGLLECACCGGNYIMADYYRYGCSTNINRGEAACPNGIKVQRRLVEERLLEGIKRELDTPEMRTLFQKKAARLLAERRARQQPEAERLKARLAKVQKEIANIMQAIRAGILTETTKAELERAEAAKRELEQELTMQTQGMERITAFLPRAADRFGELVRSLDAVAQQDVTRARTHVAALIGGKVKLAPANDGFLDAELAGDYTASLCLAGQVSRVAGERNLRQLTLPSVDL